MNRFEFLSQLSDRLRDLSPQDRRRVTDYYSEMIDDRMEEGFTEEEAVQSIGDPDRDALEVLAAMGIRAAEPAPEAGEKIPDAGSGAEPEKNIIEETAESELRKAGQLASEKEYGPYSEKQQETASQQNSGNSYASTGLSDEAIERAIRNISDQPRTEDAQVPAHRRKVIPGIIVAAIAVIGIIITAAITKKTLSVTWRLFPFNLFDADKETITVEEPVENLIIRTSSGDVRFEDSGSENVTVTVPKGGTDYKVDYQNGTLRVERKSGTAFRVIGLFGIIKVNDDIVIGLPFGEQQKSLKNAELRYLDIETSSGDITLSDRLSVTGTLRLECSSGDIVSNADLQIQEGVFKTSSGDIDIRNGLKGSGYVSDLSCRSSSGDIEIRNLSAEKLSVESSSGKVSASDVSSRDFTIRTTSGEVEYDAKKGTEDIDRFSVQTTSGDVEMRFSVIPVIKISTNSGKVSVSPAYGPEGDYAISTTSGDIRVKSY